MEPLNLQGLTEYVAEHIQSFHQRRIVKLSQLKLLTVLKRKNPYLFKAKNICTAQELITVLLDAFLSAQEETIFGEFLEGLAIFICKQVYNGRKSAAEGIDLEFDKEGVTYILSIKSGPNWGNSSQVTKMKENFRKAKRILGTNNPNVKVIAVNGCCYGRSDSVDRGEYLKLCGQRLWTFISGSESLYTDIIEPIGYQAKSRNEAFRAEYTKVINRFTYEFIGTFCNEEGMIKWEALVRYNSRQTPPRYERERMMNG